MVCDAGHDPGVAKAIAWYSLPGSNRARESPRQAFRWVAAAVIRWMQEEDKAAPPMPGKRRMPLRKVIVASLSAGSSGLWGRPWIVARPFGDLAIAGAAAAG